MVGISPASSSAQAAQPPVVSPSAEPPRALPHASRATGHSESESSRPEDLERVRVALEANKKETELLRRTVESYRDQTNGGLAIIGILLALVGLLLPILTYITSVLPANRVVEEARRTLSALDDRFLQLTLKHQSDEIDRAIERLSSEEPTLRTAAGSYLAVNAHFEFTEEQLAEICRVAEGAEQSLRIQLFSVLAGRDSPVVSRIIAGTLDGPHAIHYLHYALKQMMVPSGAHLRTHLKRWITSGDARMYLPSLLTSAATVSQTLLRDFLNDPELLHGVDLQTRAGALAALRSLAPMYRISEVLEESAFAKAFEGRRYWFGKLAEGRFQLSDPEDAQIAILYEDGVQKSTHQKGSADFAKLVKAHEEEMAGQR